MIGDDPFTTQQDIEPPVAEASPLGGELAKTLQQPRVIADAKETSIRLSVASRDGTGLALAQPDRFNHRPSSSSPLRGR